MLECVPLGDVSYITGVNEDDVRDVATLCDEPLQRGCCDALRQQFDDMVNAIHGEVVVPLSMQEATQLYTALRAAYL